MVHEKQFYGKDMKKYNQINKTTSEFYRPLTRIGIVSIPSHHSNRTQNSLTALFSSKCSFQDLIATMNSERLMRLQGIDMLPTLPPRTNNSYKKTDLNIYKMVDAAANT